MSNRSCPPGPRPHARPTRLRRRGRRVDWRIAGAGAAGLAVLLTIQNGVVQTVPRAPVPFGCAFVHQVVTWTTWLLLTPLIFRAGRRLRGRGRSPDAVRHSRGGGSPDVRLDSRLRGNDEVLDSRLRGNDDGVDSRLRGNDDGVGSRPRGNDGPTRGNDEEAREASWSER